MIARFVSVCQFCGRVYGSRLAEAPAGETAKVIASHGPCPCCFATWSAIITVKQDRTEIPAVQRALVQVERLWRAALKHQQPTRPGEAEGTRTFRSDTASGTTDPAAGGDDGGADHFCPHCGERCETKYGHNECRAEVAREQREANS